MKKTILALLLLLLLATAQKADWNVSAPFVQILNVYYYLLSKDNPSLSKNAKT